MKKLLTILSSSALVLSVFVLSSCNDSGIPISIPQTIEQTFIVPSSPDSSFTISREIAGNVDSILAAQNATRDDVQAITIVGAGVGETDSNGVFLDQTNWYELDTVFAYIGDPAKPLAFDSLIAKVPYLYSSPPLPAPYFGYVAMGLQSEGFDIVPYIIKPLYRITIVGKSRYPLTKDIYYKVFLNANFSVYL